MRTRATCAAALIVACSGLAPDAHAQTLGQILRPFGGAGSLVQTDDNAFAAGVLATFPVPWSPTVRLGGTQLSFGVYGIFDLEMIQRELEPGIVRDRSPDGSFYFYRCATTEFHACDSIGQAVEPFTAEADGRRRLYGAGYVVADLWRVRLGAGLARRAGAGDGLFGYAVGFATTPHSWIVVEKANTDAWRVRFELHAREYFW